MTTSSLRAVELLMGWLLVRCELAIGIVRGLLPGNVSHIWIIRIPRHAG